MPFIFGITLFLSAVLLFLIQPLIARMILPLLGGSPAVWLTCMVFFQAMLLAGYVYSHALSARLRVASQTFVHLLVLAAPLLALPLVSLPLHLARETTPPLGGAVSDWLGGPPPEGSPVPWLLGLLLVSVGLPFFAVSTSAPLLQQWFGHSRHASARDPYFLYAASNAGSMAALLGYPVLVEPLLRLPQQGWLWSTGYVGLLALTAVCAIVTPRVGQGSKGAEEQRGKEEGQGRGREVVVKAADSTRPQHSALSIQHSVLSTWRRLRWLVLSFVPSSLLFGVTTYLSTDIAAVPLLWVVPLALYLLTFILAFARRRVLSHRLVALALPALMVVQLFVLLIQIYGVGLPLSALVALHLLMFFAAAFLCHGELAQDRPAPERLTEFYLWLSLGGVLGGLFNALAAPVLFTSVVEYPLVLLLACLLGPRRALPVAAGEVRPAKKPQRKRPPPPASGMSDLVGWMLPPGLGVLSCLLMVYVQFDLPGFGWLKGSLMLGLPLAAYAVVCFFTPRPLWFGVPLGVMLVTVVAGLGARGTPLHGERGFYGILRVTLVREDDRGEEFVQLYHGSTLHGKQRRSDDPARRREPLTYYHPDGPVGQVFQEFSGGRAKKYVALVGLGTGSLASYGEPGQEFTFYEIDPAVIRLAQDSRYFTFLKECRAKYQIVPGDARLSLRRAADGRYGLLVVDAFSSDAIPVHLLTREACEEVYLRKLAGDGVLAFHISNRYLDLRPVLGNLAQILGLAGRVRWDEQGDDKTGRSPSVWVVLARKEADLGGLTADERWKPLPVPAGRAVWTDDYSNLLSVLRW